MQIDVKNANSYMSFFVCTLPSSTVEPNGNFSCQTLPADSSAYFSPLVEGCARKARILPNAEGKVHLKLEDAFVENHPFFKSRGKCYEAI